jgi:GT2 family glycosyltransferase
MSLIPDVTIVIAQRERFSHTKASLENLFQNPNFPFELIYVDGNSPKNIKKYLEEQSVKRNFRLIRKERYLYPNEARNLAMPWVKTKYVVFLDNDVEFKQNWLRELVNCAEETNAWLVSPLYCEGPLDPKGPTDEQKIHMAGGIARFTEIGGKKRFQSGHNLAKQPYSRHEHELVRKPTELIEYHCFLSRVDIFDQIGNPDPKLLTLAEHSDICLAVEKFGGKIYLEPKSVVSYVFPPPFDKYDRKFFEFRWSDEANLKSLIHFQEKWDLAEDDPFLVNFMRFGLKHRLRAHQLTTNRLLAILQKSAKLKNLMTRVQRAYSNFISKKSRNLISHLNQITNAGQLYALKNDKLIKQVSRFS